MLERPGAACRVSGSRSNALDLLCHLGLIA
jgi:hypothetical protein